MIHMPNLTAREKNLLLVALIVVLIYSYWLLVYPKFNEKLTSLKNEYQSLEAEKNRYESIIRNYEKNKNEIEKAKQEYKKLSEVIPPNTNAFFGVIDLRNILSSLKVETNSYMFESEQKVTMEYNTDDFYPYYIVTRQSWKCDYQALKNLIVLQEKFKPLFTIDSILMARQENNVTLNAVLNFYGFKDPNASERRFDIKRDIKPQGTGKKDLFK